MNLLGAIDKLYGGSPVQVEPAICLHTRSNQSGCQACLEACPVSVIRVTGQGPQVDPYDCIGCGRCEAACPTGAITLKETESLQQKLGGAAVAAVGCQALGAAEGIVPVPCLAWLDAESLAAAAAERTLLLVAPAAAECQSCPLGGHGPLVQTAADAARVLAAFGLAGSVHIVYGLEAARSDAAWTDARAGSVDRRQFFSLARQTLVATVGAVLRPEAAQQPLQDLPVRVSPGRRRLLATLRHKAGGQVPQTASGKGLRFADITLDNACSACEACTHVCTTGALRLETGESGDRLVFTADHCNGCGLCVRACPTESLVLSRKFRPSAVMKGEAAELAGLLVSTCRQCGTRFHGSGAVCPECRKSQWFMVDLFGG